jgi:hypothetical protein
LVENQAWTLIHDIILQEQNIIETYQQKICETVNNLFVNVAKNIGDSNIKVDETHPSIIEINNKYEYESMSKLDFQPITEDFVNEQIVNGLTYFLLISFNYILLL